MAAAHPAWRQKLQTPQTREVCPLSDDGAAV